MKQRTRDNLAYLGIAMIIVAAIVADFLYADSRGGKMWWPSRLAFRGTYTTILLAYFVGRETRRLKATLPQLLAGILFASLVHLVIILSFRQAVNQLSGLSFSGLAGLEMFFVFELSVVAVRYLRSA
jgi:uncharacterized membrane protein AbrB (regulator of aidB expression)